MHCLNCYRIDKLTSCISLVSIQTGVSTEVHWMPTSRHRLKTYVVTDACSSVAGPEGHQEGVVRLRNFLGRKCTVIKENVTYS